MSRSIHGRTAENVALAYERLRLGAKRANQVRYVGDRRGLGYDIQSCEHKDSDLPRFIEVKALTKDRKFFLTEGERKNLSKLGDRAWLYVVDIDGSRVIRLIQNPLKAIGALSNSMIYKFKI